jgi:hypothetical protein
MQDEKDQLLARLLKDYKTQKISSTQVMIEMQENNLYLEDCLPLTYLIKNSIQDFQNSPTNGDWLNQLVRYLTPIYLAHIAFIGDESVSFSQYINNIIIYIKDFYSIYNSDEKQDIFWKIIDLISNEYEK